jgi:hypothetical protein
MRRRGPDPDAPNERSEAFEGCPGLVNATIDVYETIPFG